MTGKGNHVKFACFVLLATNEEANACLHLFFVQCILKKNIRFGFCDIQNNQGRGMRLSAKPKLDITKN